jgi:hypothetical protein
MDRATSLLQGLRVQLGCWVSPIQRGVGALEVVFVDAPAGEFILRAKWKGDRQHERLFSREFVFGSTALGSPLAFRVQKRACDYAKDFMREILAQRGAL